MSAFGGEGIMSGHEGNLWGGMKRAFNLIDPDLDARMFVINAEAPMNCQAEVAMFDKADDGNASQITTTGGPVDWGSVFQIVNLPDKMTYKGVAPTGLLEFQLRFNEQVTSSDYVFIGYGRRTEEWFLLRTKRSGWADAPKPRGVEAIQDEPESLLHALATLCLYEYESRSSMPGPGILRSSLLNEQELLRRAAQRLALSNAKKIGLDQFSLFHLVANLNQFAVLPYEKKPAEGCIIISKSGSYPLSLTFNDPVLVGSHRNSRKAIEMSTREFPLLSDGQRLFGLLDRQVLKSKMNSFAEIQFFHRNWWRWNFGGRTLFEFRDGIATVPRSIIKRQTFEAKVAAWRMMEDDAMHRIWTFIEPVSNASHGAMIIISEEAGDEACRLCNDGLPIKPEDVLHGMADNLTRIDGAVLLDLNGKCHGIGYIVDGLVCRSGDPSRGARFNCAHRYVQSRQGRAFAVVVSTDGTIDFLPFEAEHEPDCT